MNTKAFFSVGRMALMAITCIFSLSFASCGGDDDELPVDELISEETTPITFNLMKKGRHILFDYAGSRLVGADTIDVDYPDQKLQTIDLRQGKHRLLWMRGLLFSEGIDDEVVFIASPYYDVKSGTVKCQDNDYRLQLNYPLPQYCIKEMEVTPYLMPEQKVEYQLLCAQIHLSLSCDFSIDDDVSMSVSGIPFVKEVGIENNRYTLGEVDKEVIHSTTFQGSGVQGRYNLALFSKDILCPKNGLNNVQLRYEVTRNGTTVYSASLPPISLQRGYKTTLRGPLVGGQTGDFNVEMYAYEGN